MTYYIKVYLENGEKLYSHDMYYPEMLNTKKRLQKDNIEFQIFKNEGVSK